MEKSTHAAARKAKSAIRGHKAIRSSRVPGSITSMATVTYERHAGRRYVMALRISKGYLVDGRIVLINGGSAIKDMILQCGTSSRKCLLKSVVRWVGDNKAAKFLI